MSGFETHPIGTSSRIAELEAENENFRGLEKAVRKLLKTPTTRSNHGELVHNGEYRKASAKVRTSLAKVEKGREKQRDLSKFQEKKS